MSSGIHLRVISYEIPQPPFTKVSLKFTYLHLNRNLPGANELILTALSSRDNKGDKGDKYKNVLDAGQSIN